MNQWLVKSYLESIGVKFSSSLVESKGENRIRIRYERYVIFAGDIKLSKIDFSEYKNLNKLNFSIILY